MKLNKIKKGNYYRLKTKKWLEKDGYQVAILECRQRIFTPKGIIFIGRDVWASDLMAANKEDLIFIQVKSNKVDIVKGMAEFKKYLFPSFVKKWVVYWESRAKEPIITEV